MEEILHVEPFKLWRRRRRRMLCIMSMPFTIMVRNHTAQSTYVFSLKEVTFKKYLQIDSNPSTKLKPCYETKIQNSRCQRHPFSFHFTVIRGRYFRLFLMMISDIQRVDLVEKEVEKAGLGKRERVNLQTQLLTG